MSLHYFSIAFSLVQIYILLQTFSIPANASPLDINWKNISHAFIPTKQGSESIQSELQCYSLPYGGIGFLSHVLTYWTLAFLAVGRKPLPPFSKLTHSQFDLLLSMISFIVCVPLAGLTIYRCHARWQFVLLAVWKTTMSFTLTTTGLHRAWKLRKELKQGGTYAPVPKPGVYATDFQPYENMKTASASNQDIETPKTKTIWVWTPIYLLGVIVGLVGLFSIVA
jgi:hypothetical protein